LTLAFKNARKPKAHERLATLIHDTRRTLERELLAYEATGDHDHGWGAKKPGDACGGGDCNVARVRRAIEALK
jgi:hypothetical protein